MQFFKLKFVSKVWKHIWIEVLILAILVFFGAYLFSIAEWRDYFTALYLTAITIGSVWYGDITPVTEMGRILSMIYALIGVPMYIFASSVIIIWALVDLKGKSKKSSKLLEVHSAVKWLISYKWKYLFLKQEIQWKLYWDLPGWRIKYGEVPLYSLRREIFEETSLDVEIGGTVGLWYFFTKDTRTQIVAHIYLCSLEKPQTIKLQKEKDESVYWYTWATIDEILENNSCIMDDNLKDMLMHIGE